MIEIVWPFLLTIAGCSQSGKTHFVIKLIKNFEKLCKTKPKYIFYFYENYNKCFEDPELNHVHFQQGLPSSLESVPENALCVYDDFQQSKLLIKSKKSFNLLVLDKEAQKLINLFAVRGSHHRNVSVIQ